MKYPQRRFLRSIRISTFSLVNALIISLLVLLVGLLDIYQRNEVYKDQQQQQEQGYLEFEKKLLRFAVRNAADYIHFRQANLMAVIRDGLQRRVSEAHRVASRLYVEERGCSGEQQVQERILRVLSSLRFDSGRGYYFAYSLDGRELLPFETKAAGGTAHDPLKERRVVRELVRIARAQGEGFYSCKCLKPGGKELLPMISFVKRFEACGWLIGAGEYIDDIRAEVQGDVLRWVNQVRFSDNGYLWVHSQDLRMVVHPFYSESSQPDWYRSGGLRDYRDPDGKRLFVDMSEVCRRQGSGFVMYRWNRPGEQGTSPKLSYVELIPEWDWIVGAGIYTDDVRDEMKQLQVGLTRQARGEAVRLAVLIFAAVLLSFGLNRYFHLRIGGAFRLFSADFQKAALEHERIDSTRLHYLELQEMAEYINHLIEDRSATDRQLKERDAQLVQLQKMEALGRLAGGIAHDFNNLLTTIIGYVEMTLMRPQQSKPTCDALQEIGKCAESAAGLTHQLLAFSRKQAVEPVVLHLNGIVEKFHGILRRLIGENIHLVTQLDPGLGLIEADQGHIEQVLFNLAANARDAMPEAGTLGITTRNIAASESPLEGRPCVLLEITDSGIGMDEATMGHIFEPFFTTKELGKGTGLGLSTVFGIVRQSGGHIAVESSPGRGSTFRLYFPRINGACQLEPAEGAAPELPPGEGTILVVEDEEPVRQMIVRTLKTSGYRVLEAAGGREALRLTRGEKAVDLILTDVIMPDMSGDQLIRSLPARYRGTPVLYMSGYTGQRHLEPATFIQKPFSPHALCIRIREHLRSSGKVAVRERGEE